MGHIICLQSEIPFLENLQPRKVACSQLLYNSWDWAYLYFIYRGRDLSRMPRRIYPGKEMWNLQSGTEKTLRGEQILLSVR